MASRRVVLKMLGLSPAAAPLVAKAAADKAVADLVGMSTIGNTAPTPGLIGASISDQSVDSWKKKVLRFLMSGKLPDWFEADLRDRCRQVAYIDPDIASKCSWSLNVKIAAQRERNIERARRDALEGPRRGLRRREFEEKFGVWL